MAEWGGERMSRRTEACGAISREATYGSYGALLHSTGRNVHLFYFTLGTLWGAPLFAALTYGVARRAPRALFGVTCLAGGVLGLVALAVLLKVSFLSSRANVQALCVAYVAYCVLGLSAVRLKPPLLGKIAFATACLSMALGFFLGSTGALGVAFLLGDAVRAPLEQRLLGEGVVCVVTTDDGIGETSYHLTLYQRRSPLPLQRRLARVDAIDVSPDAQLHCAGRDLAAAQRRL
jgi:hypothetical protein